MNKLLACIAVAVTLAGCGSPAPAPISSSYTQGYPGYPSYPGQTYLPAGMSRYQIPLYANSNVNFNGSQIQVALGTVNAGDQIVTSSLSSLMLNKNCGSSWFNFTYGATTFPILSPALAVNGNPIPNTYMGHVIAPAAGQLTLLATSNVIGGCAGNLSATWTLASGYSYGPTPIAYINRCYYVATNQVVACP